MSVNVCDNIDAKWMNDTENEDKEDWYRSTPVRDLTHEASVRGRLRRLIIRSHKARLVGTIFDIFVKSMMCILYFIRVQVDDYQGYACDGQPCVNGSVPTSFQDEEDGMVFTSDSINWHVLLWVHRPLPLWIIQVVLSLATFSKALLIIIISKVRKVDLIFRGKVLLEIICSVPFIVSMFYPALLQHLFVPAFLNCWLAKNAFEKLFNDLHITKQRFQDISVSLMQQLFILVVTMFCLIFTTICGIQHIMRGSQDKPLTMFEAFYFTVVTFSTVGYGDISPDIWIGQLFMVLMIGIAFAFVPRQAEVIASTWVERKRAGGVYGRRQAHGNKHVVVCCRHFLAENTMDFLTEFYAHPKLEEYIVILLGSSEVSSNMQIIIKDPKWSHRVIYMRGSALKDVDLMRCRMNQAEACFILPPGKCTDKEEADQHTILKSWAVKDFAPDCSLYIQLFRVESKMHVKFAEHVVCEDEFKYALLANNCLYPGLSTLVSLLMHTSTGYEGFLAPETWQKMYGQHSGNEVYHINLAKSMFFEKYAGKTFTFASADAHKRYGVTLVGVLDSTATGEPKLQLNPGPKYVMKTTDYCFYLGVTKEEYSKINTQLDTEKDESNREKSYQKMAMEMEKLISDDSDETDAEESVFNTLTSQSGLEFCRRMHNAATDADNNEEPLSHGFAEHADKMEDANVLQLYPDMGQNDFISGPSPSTTFAGTKKTICHLVKSSRNMCCLEWGKDCEHCTYKNTNDKRWKNELIILASQKANHGIYNFIIPLRSQFIRKSSLSPIILLLEEVPDIMFLETLSRFPMVYWLEGSISSVDDLLKAGIHKSSHLVVVNRESLLDTEEILSDAETIVAVQSVFKYFPNANVVTELSQASNMRFMHFEAHDRYVQEISKLEKKLKEHLRTTLTHIFRLPFAAGQVFSGSMLDTLLYQTFVKGYLIKFVRLLLGIDAEQNSGHLSSIKVKGSVIKKFRTYGKLYQALCDFTGEVPIAIYRTQKRKSPTSSESSAKKKVSNAMNLPGFSELADNNALADIIKSRMLALGMDAESYCPAEDQKNKFISYVILNPHPKLKLKKGDLVYVIQHSSMNAVPIVRRDIRRKSSSNIMEDRKVEPGVSRSRSQSLQESFLRKTTSDPLISEEIPKIPQIIVTEASSKVFRTEKVKET